MTAIPQVNTDALEQVVDRTKGKFVQAVVNDVPYLRFVIGETLHKIILKSFLRECSSSGISIPESAEDMPPKKTKVYRVVGMGLCTVIPAQRKINLYGVSVDYFMGVDKSHFEEVRQYFDGWIVNIQDI